MACCKKKCSCEKNGAVDFEKTKAVIAEIDVKAEKLKKDISK